MKEKATSKHSLIMWFIGALCAILCLRLFVLTVIENDKWQKYADDVSLRAVYETAPRGNILDRNGNIIATSKAVYSVNISRANLNADKAMKSAAKVMQVLKDRDENIQITQEDIRKTLSDKGYNAYLPVTLAKDVSEDTAEDIAEMKLSGIQLAVNYIRYYPHKNTASHIIGYLGRISSDEEEKYVDEMGYRKDAMVGKSGIEKVYEDKLKGEDAVSELQIDSSGNVKKLLNKSKAVKGEDVQLTIDLNLQEVTENALKQAILQSSLGGTFSGEYGDYKMTYAPNTESGAAVAIDVKSGEVLSLASYPDFDPNDFAVAISEDKWNSLQRKNPNDPLSPAPLYNIATMSAVQPGSTFKPITAMAALSCGLDKDKYLYDDGYIKLGDRTYGCVVWNRSEKKHGYVDLKEALKVSCNYYFYDIASGRDFASDETLDYDKEINNDLILSYAKMMGLGEKTGIQIGESSGMRPSEKLKAEGIKANLENYLLAERETYFKKSVLKDNDKLEKNVQKIVNWADKDLTLDEIIGKLKDNKAIRKSRIDDLANICKFDYFNQIGWTQGDTFNISIGQGDNAYTPLQMANYMATLGNGGVRNDVSLISDTAVSHKQASSDDIKNMKYLVDAMTEVTTSEGGSLHSLFAGFPYEVAAKTGTAQRTGRVDTEDEEDYLRRHLHLIAPDVTFSDAEKEADRLMEEYPDFYKKRDNALRRAIINLSKKNITAEDLDAYKDTYDNFAWTVALAPADDPQIAVAVLLVQGKTASNSAPVAKEIIGSYGECEGWERLF